MSDTVPRQQCHISSATSDTVPRQTKCHVSNMTGLPGQLANEPIADYKKRVHAQLAAIEAEEQRQLAVKAAQLQADEAATAEKLRLQAEADADAQARRKEAQALLQRHEANSIEKLKYWHFEPNGDEPTPEEQHKELMAKLVSRLVYTCNHLHSELANLQRAVRDHKSQHEDATRALDARVPDLEQAIPGPAARASSSAPSSRQLEDHVDHVVAMLGDISTFVAPTTTISSQLHTLKTEVQQLQTTNEDGNPKMYKMPTFNLERFDDYTQQDPVLWWEAFTTQLRILPVAKHAYNVIDALFLNSKGGCQPVPNLELPFTPLRREIYNRSCTALSQTLGDCEQYSTFAEIIDKAREIIKTNRSAAHDKSPWQPTYVEKVRTGPRQQHFAAVQQDSGDNPAATPTSSDGDHVAVVQPRSNNKFRNNGKAKSTSQAKNGQPVQVPWVKFGLTEAEYKLGKLSSAEGEATPPSTPLDSAALLAASSTSGEDANVASPRYSYEDYAVHLVPPLDQPLQVQQSTACTVSSPSATDSAASPQSITGDSTSWSRLEELDPLTFTDFQWMPVPSTGRLPNLHCNVLMAQLRDYLHTAVPTPLMDAGAEVVDLHAYIAKIDREFKTQWYDDIDAPLLYVRIQIGEATCSALIDCGASRNYISQDFMTIRNAGPLPRIDDLLERLGGTQFFSKLDLKSGYHQLEIRKEDRYKTAFKTRYGHFESLVMPFGLTNAPTTFQAAMTTEFRHMLDRFVLIYLDDILVYSRSLDEQVEHLRIVLERLRQAKYKANRDKCEFAQQELEYLGHYVTPQGIRPLADKIEALRVWSEPTNTTGVRSFMGLAGYYQRFITGYSRIAAPMTRLQSPKVPFVFDDNARRSFQALKTAMLMAPVLSINDPTLPTRVTTDASGYGIGAESGTTMKPSSARHPQTDGQTERAHETAQMMLRTLIRPDQKDWVDRLPDIEFAYNTSVHPAIGVTPFELHHGGRKGRIFADLLLPRPADIDAACSPASVRKYRELLTQARANMQKPQVRMQQQANRRRVPCPIRAGDLVWVSAKEFALEQVVSRKLLPKWFGPWSVTAAAGDEPDGPSFVINIPEHLTVHPVFHASKLATYTPAKSDDFPDRRLQDPPSMDGHQEVDRVISDRKYGSKPRQYKVTFKACDRDDTRWISGADLKASAPLIYAHYEKRRLAQEASRPAPPARTVVPPLDRQLRPRRQARFLWHTA
ncbi:hypothetical protein CBR_g12464 [Chara braunii]|uniref:Reverse transcriptase domain-containing protein n=1 Tax=Chara braunii TaxID=69332 RepID=A0A388JSE8_CHABU|nr:hypothetical protein CBR_g12464 [Chara braunii]|eukprot:GBG60726.1 hypothetical protein CBR_g12464 [Chara braunii]